MHTTTITIPAQTIEFDVDIWLHHTGMIGYATSYWAKLLDWDDDDEGITIVEGEDSGIAGGPRRKASWARVGAVIEALGRGFRLDLEGNEYPWHNEYAIAAARNFIYDPDAADGDTDVDDLIIQFSIYGELVFG